MCCFKTFIIISEYTEKGHSLVGVWKLMKKQGTVRNWVKVRCRALDGNKFTIIYRPLCKCQGNDRLQYRFYDDDHLTLHLFPGVCEAFCELSTSLGTGKNVVIFLVPANYGAN